MIVNIKSYVDFLIKHKLTANQFLVLYMLYQRKAKLLITYKEAVGGELIKPFEKDDLFKRGYLEEVKGKVRVTEKFSSEFLDKYTAANEAWEAYPPFIVNKGITFPLKAMPRSDFTDMYYKAYKGIPDEHQSILADINYGRDNGLIKVKLLNFMNAEMWKDIRRIRLNEDFSQPTINNTDRDEF